MAHGPLSDSQINTIVRNSLKKRHVLVDAIINYERFEDIMFTLKYEHHFIPRTGEIIEKYLYEKRYKTIDRILEARWSFQYTQTMAWKSGNVPGLSLKLIEASVSSPEKEIPKIVHTLSNGENWEAFRTFVQKYEVPLDSFLYSEAIRRCPDDVLLEYMLQGNEIDFERMLGYVRDMEDRAQLIKNYALQLLNVEL